MVRLLNFKYEDVGFEKTFLGNDRKIPILSEIVHKYTGQERDDFTSYDYMHYRFYASNMGRFLKPDNLIPDITNPQNWNAYTYVKGNPVNFNDPSGHMYRQIGHSQSDYAPWMGISRTPDLEEYLWGGSGGGGAGVIGTPGNTISNLLHGFNISSLSETEKGKFKDALLALNATGVGKALLGFILNSSITIDIYTNKNGLGHTTPVVQEGKILRFKIELQFGKIYAQDAPAEQYGVKFRQFSKLGFGEKADILKLAELLGHELAHVFYDLINPSKAIEKYNIEVNKQQTIDPFYQKLRYDTEHFAYTIERELLNELRNLR